MLNPSNRAIAQTIGSLPLDSPRRKPSSLSRDLFLEAFFKRILRFRESFVGLLEQIKTPLFLIA
jgi:hypothetical protein